MRPRKIKLDEIRIDGGTQPRAEIDQEAVGDYAEDMRRGDVFPPVEVVSDGVAYWLTNGFHRYHATKKAGQKSIAAHVLSGTQDDAIWASLAANKTHGLRRTNADKVKAIRTALRFRSKLSSRVIADHIGVSGNSVLKYKAEMQSTAQVAQSNTVTSKDGRERPAHPKSGTPIDISAIPMGDGEPRARPEPAEPADQVGTPITGGKRESIVEALARRGEITDLMGLVSKIKTTVAAAKERGDPLFAEISMSNMQADCGNVRRALRAARPFAVCVYCSGDGCKACLDRGWMGEFAYKACAASELKGDDADEEGDE